MKSAKKLTLSAMIVALGVLFMTLGYFVEPLDLTVGALLSLLMVFVCIEIGAPYNLLVWIATSLLGALFFTANVVWVTYFAVFGIYPIIKGYIQRLPKIFAYPVKLLSFNVLLLFVILITEFVLMIPFFVIDENMTEFATLIKVGAFLLFNVAFIIYDVFLNVMIRFYFNNLRRRFASLLK